MQLPARLARGGSAREYLAVREWRDTVTGVLDKTRAGLTFTSFTTDAELTVDDKDVERARVILERAQQYCIIAKALNVEVTVVSHVWEHDQRVPFHPPAPMATG